MQRPTLYCCTPQSAACSPSHPTLTSARCFLTWWVESLNSGKPWHASFQKNVLMWRQFKIMKIYFHKLFNMLKHLANASVFIQHCINTGAFVPVEAVQLVGPAMESTIHYRSGLPTNTHTGSSLLKRSHSCQWVFSHGGTRLCEASWTQGRPCCFPLFDW